MNVLVIGGGGREHALCWALSKSPVLEALYCAPGNSGIATLAQCMPLDGEQPDAVIGFCREHHIHLVIIGPEAPLAIGLKDKLEAAGVSAFGPTAAAAQLETSKSFTRALCDTYGIPGAAWRQFDNRDSAKAYVDTQPLPLVIKADGLAAGKGVIIAPDEATALSAIDDMFDGAFGEGSQRIVIEEYLTGEEVSLFALCDGETILPLAAAQDYKRAGNGDSGPNTGGMGACSPVPSFSTAMQTRAMETIITPTIRAMKEQGMPFTGILYAGLMLTNDGPRLIEFNVRFGDPECQVLMMRLQSDLLTALNAAVDGTLHEISLEWRQEAALTVVMASEGYPGTYKKDTSIRGLEKTATLEGVEVFHAATTLDEAGMVRATGGRVLNITACGKTLEEARSRAYEAIRPIDWPQGFYRTDIGHRSLKS
ncbi:MAG: phosphoribosylamine--glycine ligase [Parvularculales bacterium]